MGWPSKIVVFIFFLAVPQLGWTQVPPNPAVNSPQAVRDELDESLPTSESATLWPVVRIIGLPISWATIILNFVVIPFFNKRESLHREFLQRMKFAIAHIETNSLIPSLVDMFTMATRSQKDKRKRPEPELETLLLSVDVAPYLENAQKAMSEIDSIRSNYGKVKVASSVCWKVGLLHVMVTILLPLLHLYALPLSNYAQWLIGATWIVWIVTIVVMFQYVFVIASRMGHFLDSLEATEGEEAKG